MRIIVDNNIPYIRGVLEPFADMCYLPSGEINHQAVANASALVIRTRTKCNKELLEGSAIQMIATATIGFDHIDTNYCTAHNITVSTSAGCNARGVAQWVFAALRELNVKEGTIGVVGVGNVGQQVCQMATSAGFKVLKCDPPRAAAEGGNEFVTLDELLKNSDVVTMHVPLNKETNSLANNDFFKQMKNNATFLNSSRGEVVDEQALMRAITKGEITKTALDVWRNEPAINKKLVQMVNLATPHIAGYSARGKAMATQMAVQAVARKFNIIQLQNWKPNIQTTLEQPENYHITTDDKMMRNNVEMFESLRMNYNYR